jgi:RHS repeat-associated protein
VAFDPSPLSDPNFTSGSVLGGMSMRLPVPGRSSLLNPDLVVVTVFNTDGLPKEGLPVYVFDGTFYTGFHDVTDANGEASFDLPDGSYRFRSDLNGTQFWSGETDHCTIPGCLDATVVVTLPVTVTVTDTDLVPQEGLPIYAFTGGTYTGFHGTTDENGEVQLTLPQGDYRFRSDLNGTQFWSGEANHCTLPGCESASVTVTIPLTVTVQSQTGSPCPDLPVYAFSGESYTGFHGTTDENGETVFTLPMGDYRFRTDYDGVQFWSGESNHCTIPGCLEAQVEIPGGVGEVDVTIDYTYDALNRLTAADYSTGEYFHYQYDLVGNRLQQDTHEGTNLYIYDDANRLIDVDGVTFTWDDNGNLIQDDLRIYHYDHANRLDIVLMGGDNYTFGYNGVGDRLRQTVNGESSFYSLDLIANLTQVLNDGTNSYLYGLQRVGEEQPDGWQYHLPDALGSMRQLTDVSEVVSLAQSYEPYGSVLNSAGSASTAFQFTSEQVDLTKLVYLRARYYSPSSGRLLTRDTWNGDPYNPLSLHKWIYVVANPTNLVDPSGRIYDRSRAIRAALSHDLLDPFPVRGYDWRNEGTDCTTFASYVLWEGGIRDPRPSPLKDKDGTYIDYKDVSYWNGDWSQSDTPWYSYPGIQHTSWIRTPDFYAFLTNKLGFMSYTIPNNDYLSNNLKHIWFDIGDMVFYGTRPEFGHVAVIVQKWGEQTFFGVFPPLEVPRLNYSNDEPNWTDYWFVGEDTAEERVRLTGDALEIWRLSRCDANWLPYLPRVVERSGRVFYYGSRSINNTSEGYSSFTIVHIR